MLQDIDRGSATASRPWTVLSRTSAIGLCRAMARSRKASPVRAYPWLHAPCPSSIPAGNSVAGFRRGIRRRHARDGNTAGFRNGLSRLRHVGNSIQRLMSPARMPGTCAESSGRPSPRLEWQPMQNWCFTPAGAAALCIFDETLQTPAERRDRPSSPSREIAAGWRALDFRYVRSSSGQPVILISSSSFRRAQRDRGIGVDVDAAGTG